MLKLSLSNSSELSNSIFHCQEDELGCKSLQLLLFVGVASVIIFLLAIYCDVLPSRSCAEKIRSALGGLTTDRRENIHSLDSMTRDEIVARLSQLQKQYPQVFIEGNFKKVEDDDRKKSLDKS